MRVMPPLGKSIISASTYLKNLVDGPISDVYVQSCEGQDISAVIENATNAFLVNSNPKELLRALGLASDSMNTDIRDGNPRQIACRCTDETRTYTVHTCDFCFRPTFCNDLKSYEPRTDRICKECNSKLTGVPVKAQTPLEQARGNLKGLIFNEHRHIEATSPPDRGDQLTRTWNDLKDKIHQNSSGHFLFTDWYAPAGKIAVSFSSSYQRRPMALSIDAIMPYYPFITVDGILVPRLHVPNNVVLTTLGLNLVAHLFLKGTLHLIRVCWSHTRQDSTSPVPFAEIQERIMQHANEIHLVALGAPYQHHARLNQPISQAKFDVELKEWISSTPRSELRRKELEKKKRYVHDMVRPPTEWEGKPEGWDTRTKPIILELERRAGKKLPRGTIDDCPYPVSLPFTPISSYLSP